MSLFANDDNSAVGLDIDGAFLAAAVVKNGSIGRVASVDLPAGLAADGEVTDPGALSGALKDMFARHKLPRTVRLGVANQQIVVRQMDMPLIEDLEQRATAVRFQAADAIAMPLDEAVLDFEVIGAYETSDGTPRHRVLVVAARSSMVMKVVEAVKGAGLKPEGVDLSAFALVRMLSDPEPVGVDADRPGRVLCHLGGLTNLAIAIGPLCAFTRSLQTSWSPDEAVLSSIAEEVRLSIDFYRQQEGARELESIILSGPGAHDGALEELLGARTGLPVAVGAPLGALGAHTVPSDDDPYRYTVAAGLALGATA